MHQIVLLEALLPYTDTKAPQLFMENLMVFPFLKDDKLQLITQLT